jgi:ABC-type transporter Mla MlaB component
MLKIERASNGKVVLRLSGAIQGDEVAELDRVIKLETGAHLVLDLENVTRVDREGVRFLGRCAHAGAVLENSPAYIREWIARECESTGRSSNGTQAG